MLAKVFIPCYSTVQSLMDRQGFCPWSHLNININSAEWGERRFEKYSKLLNYHIIINIIINYYIIQIVIIWNFCFGRRIRMVLLSLSISMLTLGFYIWRHSTGIPAGLNENQGCPTIRVGH